jgi:hypothetical protein
MIWDLGGEAHAQRGIQPPQPNKYDVPDYSSLDEHSDADEQARDIPGMPFPAFALYTSDRVLRI